MSARPSATRRWTVDRREGAFFVVEEETGTTLDIPAWLLPPGTREGDVLDLIESPADANARQWLIRRNPEAAERATDQAKALLRRLEGRDPGGDITL
jgi:hypothetical protein